MKIGDIEFEIEAQPDQIQTAVDKILTTVTERLKNTNLAQVAERPAPPPRAETCKGIIQKLWEENWFNEPRGLDDVHTELASTRLPLRPHRRSTRTSRPRQRQHTHTHRQTTPIPIRTKKTTNLSFPSAAKFQISRDQIHESSELAS